LFVSLAYMIDDVRINYYKLFANYLSIGNWTLEPYVIWLCDVQRYFLLLL